MDIYKWDDIQLNQILKSLEIVSTMKKGCNELKTRSKTAFKSKEITKEENQYIKETIINMKRFVQYKEDFFKKNKI